MKALQGHVSQLRKVLGAERLSRSRLAMRFVSRRASSTSISFEQFARQGREHLGRG